MKLKPTLVTGSLIPTAETVGPAPLETISAAQIQKVGATDVSDLVKKLSSSFSGNGNVGQEVDNGGFGEANLLIYNLPTLVLLNGRRLGNSSFSNGQLVDLNTIPLAAIDRIEILKDGSSALYGSAAIGGVVNIITKKNYSGLDLSGRYGGATGKGNYYEEQASYVSGATTDRGEFMVSAQYYHSDPLLTTDRKIAHLSIDQLDNKKLFSGTYFSPSFPGEAEDNTGRYVLSGSPLVTPPAGYTIYNTPPAPPGPPGQTFTGPNAVADYNQAFINAGMDAPYLPADDIFLNTTKFGVISIQSQDRVNVLAEANYDIIDKQVQFFSTFMYANLESEGNLAPSPMFGLGVKESNISVPSNNVYNPFGIDLGPLAGTNGVPPAAPKIRSRFSDSGNREFDSQTDYYHFVGGLKGEFEAGYTYNAAYTYNEYDQTQFTRNAINGAALDLALQPNIDPTKAAAGLSQLQGFNGQFVPMYNIFGIEGQNDPTTLDAISTTLFQSGKSVDWTADMVLGGTPFELPGGKIGFAVGGGYESASL
ncbi:MAG TPA: TonB-dependent receptor plug domain-containing protein, partial [Verrucomicrobiae bacterium]|nr:TonB-dependent receptor plug domain-containing protein [Verrucomicrobiae bacterium]